MAQDRTCFVISPIGDPDSETRKRADQVLKHVIKPAVAQCGYKAMRADEIDKPGIITSQVIQHVVTDPLVVADLTERNPNVFYELAVRHALRKPLVQIIRKGEAIPFDVAHTRTIYVDHKDLDSVETAKTDIIEQVKALEKDTSSLETPISVSLDLQILRQSEKPEERSLADLVAAVSEARSSLAKIESRLGTKDQQGLLDEMRTELRVLNSRMEDMLEGNRIPLLRRGRIHPMMLESFMGSQGASPAVGILVIASIFKDTMPWVYELGVDASRLLREGRQVESMRALEDFRRILEYSLRGPMAREMVGRNKEVYMLYEEIIPALDHIMAFSVEEFRTTRKK